MVLDTAKLTNRKSTKKPGMRGRDAAEELTQLAFGWTEQKCIEMDELAKQNHTYHLSTEEFQKIPRTMVSRLEQVRQRTRLCDFDQILELQSLSKTVFIVSQVRKSQNQFLQHNTADGTFPQAIAGGARPKAGGDS